MLLGKQRKNKQLSRVIHISFLSVLTFISLALVKRQLPFVGGRVLQEQATGLFLNSTAV